MLGKVMSEAVRELRAEVGDPTAAIAIVTPSTVNGTLARRELALETAFVRVELWTPAELESSLAEPVLRRDAWRTEPPGWLRATLRRELDAVDALPGGYERVLREPGWLAAIVSSVAALEGGDVDPAVLRGLALPPGLAERAAMMAVLLARVADARERARVAGPRELGRAARRAIDESARCRARETKGAILLGDARVRRTTFEVLARWLGERPVVRIEATELRRIEPERYGLTAAAPDARVVSLPARAPGVRFVRSPDPVRECAEAVRAAQDAVRDGTPLDRIAIVLPDPAEATTLRDALGQAGLPATWQTGPALSETPAARFLLHCLALALGDDGALGWYELLRQPELRLRRALGEGATQGRGRWRRLLSRSGAVRGTARILAGLERLGAEEIEGEEASAREARLQSLRSLRGAIVEIHGDLEGLRQARSVGAHARALRALVERWWAPTPDQRVLVRMLEGWGRADVAPAIELGEMATTMREALEGAEVLSGSLSDASVRVLSPMQLLGGSFDVVLVTGMNEGRFPAQPSEDPVLANAIVDAIEARVPAGLFRSSARVALERRRLASVRSAAERVLWLSAPAVEMLEGRPLLPGSLLLELASELEGARVSPSELVSRMERVGSRSRAHADDPARAIGRVEHLLARLFASDDAVRQAALQALADHVVARRLLARERAATRLADGDRDPALRAHAGFVDLAVLACRGLDGTPLQPEELAELVESPEAFLLRQMLRAWPAPKLRDAWQPVAAWYARQVVREESSHVLERRERLVERLAGAFEQRVSDELERAGVDEPGARERLSAMGQRAIDGLVRAEPSAGTVHAMSGAPLDASSPWTLTGGRARRVGSGLEWVVDRVPGPRSMHKAVAHLIEAAARRSEGAVEDVRWVDLDGKSRPSGAAPLIVDVLDRVALAIDRARAGWFPPGEADPAALAEWQEDER